MVDQQQRSLPFENFQPFRKLSRPCGLAGIATCSNPCPRYHVQIPLFSSMCSGILFAILALQLSTLAVNGQWKIHLSHVTLCGPSCMLSVELGSYEYLLCRRCLDCCTMNRFLSHWPNYSPKQVNCLVNTASLVSPALTCFVLLLLLLPREIVDAP